VSSETVLVNVLVNHLESWLPGVVLWEYSDIGRLRALVSLAAGAPAVCERMPGRPVGRSGLVTPRPDLGARNQLPSRNPDQKGARLAEGPDGTDAPTGCMRCIPLRSGRVPAA